MAGSAGGGLHESIVDLQRYLSDDLAPMMAADAIDALLDQPPAVVADAIGSWIEAQFQGIGKRISWAEYAFHALKKILRMAEFELLPRQRVATCVAEVATLMVKRAHADQREALTRVFEELGTAEAGLARPVNLLHRPPSMSSGEILVPAHAVAPPLAAAGAPPGTVSGMFPMQSVMGAAPVASPSASGPEMAQGLQRLGAILERLESRLGEPAALAAAATAARSSAELGEMLARVGAQRIDADTTEVFRELAKQISGYVLPATGEADAPALPPSHSTRAMERLVDLADSPADRARRLHDLVLAAIERLEEGELPQAAKMFEVATKVVAERRLPPDVVLSLTRRAREQIRDARLAELVADSEQHAILRGIFAFFPSLQVRGLMLEIYEETQKERRQLLLNIVRAWGEHARAPLLEILGEVLTGDPPDPQGWYRRNILFALRRTPRRPGSAEPREAELVARAVSLDQPMIVLKEGIGALGAIDDAAAETALLTMLRDVERPLTTQNHTLYTPVELHHLLDRIAGALVALSSPSAARHVANHGLREEPSLGDTMGRLALLGRRDLASDPPLVDALVGRLRATLPRKVLGMPVGGDVTAALALVRALAGTSSPSVRALLAEIASAHGDHPLGRAARTPARPAAPGLASGAEAPVPSTVRVAKARTTAQSLAGDVALFGLPNLLQSLTSSGVTGDLTLQRADGSELGRIGFADGRLARCASGGATGTTALYMLLETPQPGHFAFSAAAGGDTELPDAEFTPPVDPMPYVLEGLRRHDELGPLRAIVPDDSRFARGTANPSLLPDEEDREFSAGLWRLVFSHMSAEECERRLGADPFRVKRMLAHWVETRALVVVAEERS